MWDNLNPIKPQDKLNSDQAINRWLSTGQFHVINNINLDQKKKEAVVDYFNPCSSLPLVKCNLLGIQKVAIIDSGAVKSLLSSAIAIQLWGSEFQNLLSKNCECILKDVNFNIVSTLGTIDLSFQIGNYQFTFNFIIYQSQSNEILLGFDFLRHFNLGIFPNLGLVRTECNINNILCENKSIFILQISENVDIPPLGQLMVRAHIDHENDRNILAILNQQHFLAHSELLEPDKKWEELMVFFQYITLDANLQTQILIVNHSDFILHLNINHPIAHVEIVHEIANINKIQEDPFASNFLTQINLIEESLKSKSIIFPEEKICIDPPESVKFDPLDINCHTQQPALINWLTNLHLKYKTIFSSREFDPGEQNGSSIHFSVKTNATIIHQKFHQINPKIMNRARDIIDTLLARNLIELSDSPWSSRVIFVEKTPDEKQIKNNKDFIPGEKVTQKQNKLRLVIDLRHVNTRLRSVSTNWVVPSIFSILEEFHDAKYVSTIDINSGFWSFKLSEKARKLTAFQFESDTFQLTRLVQGLKCSSSFMQLKMRKIVLKYKLQGTTVYIDNIIVRAADLEAYKQRLAELFEACLTEGIKIKQNKSHHFIQESFVLFGFTINLLSHTISPELSKVNKLLQMERPDTKKRVRAFIGGTSYFSHMVDKFQQIMSPLHNLAAPKTKFLWTDSCQLAFDTIKKTLAKLPFLYLYNPSKTLHFFCDGAMGSFIAYCLYQFSDDTKNYLPIKYNSHKLSVTESTLSQFETESLALIFAITREPGLIGFGNAILHTDAKGLTFISRFSKTTAKLARWDIFLKSFDIQVKFLPNNNALIKMTDLLTRNNDHQNFKNKVTQQQIDEFMQLDFGGLPQMSLKDTMFLIQKALQLLNLTAINKKIHSNINIIFPDVPNLILPFPQQGSNFIHYCANQHIFKIQKSTKFSFQNNDLDNVSINPSNTTLDMPSWSNQPAVQKHKLREALLTFLPNISRQYLIKMQQKTEWIKTIIDKVKLQKSHKEFFLFHDILLKKFKTENNIMIHQIVLPCVFAKPLIERFHKMHYFKHLGIIPMSRHLQLHFYIKNFKQVAQDIVKNCSFCLYNKQHPLKKMEPGLRMSIDRPRVLIYWDICTLRSAEKEDSFLTIVDGFSKFVIFIPVSRHATAHQIVECLFSHWIRHYGIPLLISSDGGSNFVNKLTGQIAAELNIKTVRIAPYNSKANLAERYNAYCLFIMKIFHQSYKITNDNFSMLLALASQMLNQQINKSGFSPHFLHLGSNPRKNTFITLRNINTMKNESDYVKQLIAARNIIFFIGSRIKAKNEKIQKSDQLQQFKRGDFVLLKKINISTPRHLHKAQPLFHTTIYRIIRRTRTNAYLIPFNKKFMQNRLKFESKIPKNMVTLQRLSNLKKVKNILPLLNLSISQKMILELDKIISMSNIDVTEVQCIKQEIRPKNLPIIKDFAPSILIDNGSIPPSEKDCVPHVANIQLQTLQPESTSTEFQSDTLSYVTKTKIINPKKNCIISDWGSSSQDNFSSFDLNNTFTSIDNPVLEEIPTDISYHSSDDLSESDEQIQEIESVRITPGSPKATTTRTFIRLPSGKALSIKNASAQQTIVDKQKTPSVQFSKRPKSLIKDFISSKK